MRVVFSKRGFKYMQTLANDPMMLSRYLLGENAMGLYQAYKPRYIVKVIGERDTAFAFLL